MNIQPHIIPLVQIEKGWVREMYELHRTYFDNMQFKTFLRDLEEKDWLILLKTPESSIAGFSTIQILSKWYRGQNIIFIYSGDTIVGQKYWNTNALAPTFGLFLIQLLKDCSDSVIFWFLLTKGYRTYRYLSVYFKEFFPVYHGQCKHEYRNLRDFIAREKFGSAYDPRTGIVSFQGTKEYLNKHMQLVPVGKQSNPHVQYFLKKNPGYVTGDELACIVPITETNFNQKAKRVINNIAPFVQWAKEN